MEELTAWPVYAFVGVGTEKVALGLEEIGGEPRSAIAVEIGKRRGHRGQRGPMRHRRGADPPPAGLGLFHFAVEKGVQQEVGERGITIESFLDLAQKRTSDDAAAAIDLLGHPGEIANNM